MFVAAAALLGSCERGQEVAKPERPRAIKAITLEDGGIERVIEFPGQIEAVLHSRKAFEVSGRIIDMPVKEGQDIRKGDVLARIDARDFESAVASAKANHEAARAVEKRIRPLFEKRAVSQQELDLAERDLRTAEEALKRAEKALEDTRIVADFDGKVANVLVEDFANVLAKQDVMIIQDASSLEIIAHVPESVMTIPIPGETNAEKVANSNPVVIPSTMPTLEIPVHYSESAERPDPVTRTYEVTLAFTPPPGGMIRPGMTAKVRAVIPARHDQDRADFAVPMGAVFSDGNGGALVWKIDRQAMTVSQVGVKTGAVAGESIAVAGELRPGDLIAASGIHHLREGQKVRLWELP